MKTPRKIIATTALPYANGEVHIGHLLEHLQVDVWVRALRMAGHDAHMLSADDTHGTPIMIRAREEGITPEKLIERAYKEHVADLTEFQNHYSYYSSTNSLENKELCEEFYRKMKAKGHIAVRPVKQLYCPHDKMFLPDRFVKGTCPKCGTPDQYGDSCDNCGSTYSPSELKNPHCYLCGTAPIEKSSDHYFFKLNDFKDYLEKWLPKHCAPEVGNKMMEWFKEDLRDWDISRDEPYFGFPIPDAPGKFFYVWVDAPVGYVSTTKKWCVENKRDFDSYWRKEDNEVYHFIGKDIIYFHTLFWPALLKAADFRTPTYVAVHGFVNVNGEKMSKSKGTMVPTRVYLKHLDPAYLRYYYVSKLNSRVDDMDLNLDDFVSRVNSDLIGKITNLGSRGAQMLGKKLDGVLSQPDADGAKLIAEAQKSIITIAADYEAREYSKAINEIRRLADETNKYFDEKVPWKTIDTDPVATKAVLTTTLNIFRLLTIGLTPVLPKYSEEVALLLGEQKSALKPGESSYSWASANEVLKNRKIGEYKHLATRVDPDKVKAMIEETRLANEELQKMRAKAKTGAAAKSAAIATKTEGKTVTAPTDRNAIGTAEIEFDDFMKVDLRVGKIVAAEEIKEADKLLRLTIDIGGGVTKQIISGIKAAYKPETLVGRQVLVCVNLKPRKMKFGMSEGMVLAAGDGGADLFLLSPDNGAKAGSRVQ